MTRTLLYVLGRVLAALAIAAAFGLVGWIGKAHAYPAASSCQYLFNGVDRGSVGAAVAACFTAQGAGASLVGYCTGNVGGATSCPTPNPSPPSCNGTNQAVYPYTILGGGSNRYTCGLVQVVNGGLSCPNGGTLSGSSCTCPAGYTDSGTACVQVVTCEGVQVKVGNVCTCPATAISVGTMDDFSQIPATWEYTVSKDAWASAPVASSGCFNGCAVNGRKSAWVTGTGYYSLKSTGATCSGNSIPSLTGGTNPAVAPTNEAECLARGGSPGTVGSTFHCLPKAASPDSRHDGPSTSKSKETINPDGSKTVTTTTSTPTTVCEAGACNTTINTTTTTTTFAPNGTPTGTTTTTGTSTRPGGAGNGEGGGCDPAEAECGPQTSFGGTCEGGFVCDGDAIQCAMARKQYIDSCIVFTKAGTYTQANAEADFAAQSDGNVVGAGRLVKTEVDASTAFTTTDRVYGGAAGLSDWSVGALTIPLSQMNTPLSYLGYIVLIFCTLWGAQIMFAGRAGGA